MAQVELLRLTFHAAVVFLVLCLAEANPSKNWEHHPPPKRTSPFPLKRTSLPRPTGTTPYSRIKRLLPSFNQHLQPSQAWWADGRYTVSQYLALLNRMPDHQPHLSKLNISAKHLLPNELYNMAQSDAKLSTRIEAYLRYSCRDKVRTCPHLEKNYTTFCDFVQKQGREQGCLASGCSAHELVWLEQASCNNSSDIEKEVEVFRETTWTVNDALMLSLVNVSSQCRSHLNTCIKESFPAQGFPPSLMGTFCILVVAYPTCVEANHICDRREVSMLQDAACDRAYIEFEDKWSISTPFRVAMAAVPLGCQRNVETCRRQAVAEGAISNFCDLMANRGRCSESHVTEPCSHAYWSALTVVACRGRRPPVKIP